MTRCFLAFALAVSFAFGSLRADDERPIANVGIVYDGPSDGEPAPAQHLQLTEILIREAAELTKREFDVRFPIEKRLSGHWSRAGVVSALERLLTDPEVQIVLALGTLASNEACRLENLTKPLIAPYVIDPVVQVLPSATDAEGRLISGVRNLTYLTTPGGALNDLKAFLELAPFSRIHTPVDEILLEGIPQISEFAAAIEEQIGAEIVLIPATDSAQRLLERIPADAQAVYLPPLYRFSDAQFDEFVAGLIARGLPSFSLVGRSEVERGIMAGIRIGTEQDRLARRVALDIQRTLLGEDAATLPVIMEQDSRLSLNMGTARAIGFPVTWRVNIHADLIDRDAGLDRGRPLTLDGAVREAIDANLGVRAKERDVAAGEESISQARSRFRPALGVGVGGLIVDADRARASFGSLSERALSGTLQLDQLVYSDATFANLSIATDLQRSRALQLDALRLDIAVETATVFLDLLRSIRIEEIARENLRLTESNLARARKREQIGYSGPADIYRWETALANDRTTRIATINEVRAVRLALNRLMARPLKQAFDPAPPDLEDPKFLTGFGRLEPYLDSEAGGLTFTDFLVTEGYAGSPEIRSLDAAIAAQKRTSLAARRDYWAPRIGLVGEIEHYFERSGAGSESILGAPNDDNWSVALTATLPLYAGGLRPSLLRESNEDLARLRFERASIQEGIELRIRVGMTRAGTSYPAIALAREGADAARRNLDLVTDSYSRGAVPIIDLLDAQRAAIVAEVSASNAIFDFFIDLMQLQRASNNLGFLMSQTEREAWFERLEHYFEQAGIRPGPWKR